MANDTSTPVLTPAVTVASTQVFRDTEPMVASTDPLIAGRLFHEVVASGQVVFGVVDTTPPAGLPALLAPSTCSRSRALCTVPVTFRRSKRMNVWLTGDPSTVSCPDDPAVAFGAEASTVVSATGVRVTVAASAGGAEPMAWSNPTVRSAASTSAATPQCFRPACDLPIVALPATTTVGRACHGCQVSSSTVRRSVVWVTLGSRTRRAVPTNPT